MSYNLMMALCLWPKHAVVICFIKYLTQQHSCVWRTYAYYIHGFVKTQRGWHTSRSEQVHLHLIISTHIELANFLMGLLSFQSSELLTYSNKLQLHTLSSVISTVSVLIHTRQSNINAEATDDGEYNLQVRVWCMWGGRSNVPSVETAHSLSIVTQLACYTVSRWDFWSNCKWWNFVHKTVIYSYSRFPENIELYISSLPNFQGL
jgi:hypothetical protein